MLVWLVDVVNQIGSLWGADSISTFDLGGRLAVILVGLTCGLVGSLVVGNRMAFFSDAMAHTAFAGLGITLLGAIVLVGARQARDLDPYYWLIPLVMASIGAMVGLTMAYVREQTGLANDTVIGVFFALSIGVGAMLLPQLPRWADPDQLLFGSAIFTTDTDLLTLIGMLAVTATIVTLKYNSWVFASFNASLACSRGIPTVLNNYLFVVLLAIVVNLSIKSVGVLLINALLVVPAAAAANVATNLRQFFWVTIAGSVASSIIGYELSDRLAIPLGTGDPLRFGTGGTIVVVCVAWFFATMTYAGFRRGIK